MASILGFFSVSPACAGMIQCEMRLDGFAKVSPACAGMIPRHICFLRIRACEPRMRGDDPAKIMGVHVFME